MQAIWLIVTQSPQWCSPEVFDQYRHVLILQHYFDVQTDCILTSDRPIINRTFKLTWKWRLKVFKCYWSTWNTLIPFTTNNLWIILEHGLRPFIGSMWSSIHLQQRKLLESNGRVQKSSPLSNIWIIDTEYNSRWQN